MAKKMPSFFVREHVTLATPRETPRVTPRQRSATQATFVRRTQTHRDTPRHQHDTVCHDFGKGPHFLHFSFGKEVRIFLAKVRG